MTCRWWTSPGFGAADGPMIPTPCWPTSAHASVHARRQAGPAGRQPGQRWCGNRPSCRTPSTRRCATTARCWWSPTSPEHASSSARARQRPPARLPAGRGAQPRRVVRLRRQVHRGLADVFHAPAWSPPWPAASRSWRWRLHRGGRRRLCGLTSWCPMAPSTSGEMNTIPGFTATSMFPKQAELAGIGFGELIDRLIELGLDRAREQSGGDQ